MLNSHWLKAGHVIHVANEKRGGTLLKLSSDWLTICRNTLEKRTK